MDKNRKENGKFNEKEWYKNRIIETVRQVENGDTLKKIYTFAKTINEILNEKEGV